MSKNRGKERFFNESFLGNIAQSEPNLFSKKQFVLKKERLEKKVFFFLCVSSVRENVAFLYPPPKHITHTNSLFYTRRIYRWENQAGRRCCAAAAAILVLCLVASSPVYLRPLVCVLRIIIHFRLFRCVFVISSKGKHILSLHDVLISCH